MSSTDWFSIHWFLPSTLSEFTWESPFWLYVIIAIPFLFLLKKVFNFSFRQKMPVALSKAELKSDKLALLRYVPPFFFAMALALIFVALARPQKSNEHLERWSEGVDIVMAIDISESMKIEDFKPNRLDAAKKMAIEFINGRFQDRIGVVIFSGDAYSLAPLTTDYDLLKKNIADIDFDMIQNGGTAIGSALGVATNRMRESTSKTKIIILLSDGENTAGNIDPITAAKLAEAYGIKIYTIAIGKEGLVPWGKDIFGRPNMVENTLNEATLREIAEIGKGQFFRVMDNRALKNVFETIDKYEKTEIKENRYRDTTDFYYSYLYWAIIFLLMWLLCKNSFMNNFLQD